MATIHPLAIVDPAAELAADVEIGPFAIVESDVVIGSGTVLRPHAVVRRHTVLGSGNLVDSFAVLGGEPQDLKFDPRTRSTLRIGDGNVFREGVTISRATGDGLETVVGNRGYWMANSHAGHNATVGDDCILVNGAALAGHTTIGRGVILSFSVAVHQFCWVGDGVMTQGSSAISMHTPPYCLVADISRIVGLNRIGLKRSKTLTDTDRAQIKEAFRITYRSNLTFSAALAAMAEHTEWGAAASSFRDFVRRALEAKPPFHRGLSPRRSSQRQAEE